MGIVSPVWGPFTDPGDASNNLCKFSDSVLGPGFGVAWIAGGKLYTIRKPHYDNEGFGEIIVFEFAGIPPVTAPPPDNGGGITEWFSHMWNVASTKVVAEAKYAGHAIENGFARVWTNAFGTKERRMDGLGVAVDALGIGASLVLMSFGPLEVLGAVALIGGAALLVMDGAAYVSEIAGADKTADNIKHATFYPRCLATLATLPDAIWGIGKVVLDGAEIAARVASSASTADRAAGDAARVLNTGRDAESAVAASRRAALAERYAQIGEAAQRRAKATQTRLHMFISGQSVGRATIPPGIYFLTKEATDDPERRGEIQRILKLFTFHVSAVHRA